MTGNAWFPAIVGLFKSRAWGAARNYQWNPRNVFPLKNGNCRGRVYRIRSGCEGPPAYGSRSPRLRSRELWRNAVPKILHGASERTVAGVNSGLAHPPQRGSLHGIHKSSPILLQWTINPVLPPLYFFSCLNFRVSGYYRSSSFAQSEYVLEVPT